VQGRWWKLAASLAALRSCAILAQTASFLACHPTGEKIFVLHLVPAFGFEIEIEGLETPVLGGRPSRNLIPYMTEKEIRAALVRRNVSLHGALFTC